MTGERARASILISSGLAAAGAAAFAWTPLYDVDWPWHLATFELAWRERRFVWDAPWSYAQEGTLPPCHWLFEVALGLAHRAFDLTGIELLRVLLVAAAFALLARALVRRSLGAFPAAAIALTVAAASRVRFLERPHLVTAIGIVLLWDLLVDFRDRGRKRLAALVPLFLVWANAHPGVVHGAILATGFLVAEAARTLVRERLPDLAERLGLRALPRERLLALALWIGLGLAATFANPAGPGLYPYLLGQRALQKDLHVLELRRLFCDANGGLDLSHRSDWELAGLVLVAAVIALRQRRELDLTDTAGAAGFVVLAGVLARESELALVSVAIAIAPGLAELLAEAKDELAELGDKRHATFAWVFGLALGLGLPAFELAHMAATRSFGTGLEPSFFPVREADWILREKPAGPLWNTNAAGGYLVWRLDPVANPQWRVFTDGRTPLFHDALQLTFLEAEARWHPNLVVLDYRHLPWVGETSPELAERWALVHFSDGGRTYLKRTGPNAALAAKGYAHVRFVGVRDPQAPFGWRTAIVVDPRDPAAAHAELLARALAEEPSGAWANAADAEALALLGKRDEAVQAARRALAAQPSLVEARAVLESQASGSEPR